MTKDFRDIFGPQDGSESGRSKYLSRLFGIFSEKIVSIWAGDDRAPFEDLGRPTLRFPGDKRGHTLDFTFQDRSARKIYVVEMKCEIQYLNFKHFVLDSVRHLDHHKKPAFDAFLKAATYSNEPIVRVQNREVKIDGAILIWGAVDPEAASQIKSDKGLHDILSVEDICRDLVDWQNPEYLKLIEQYRTWSNRLFDGLISAGAAYQGAS